MIKWLPFIGACIIGLTIFLLAGNKVAQSFQQCVADERAHQSANDPNKSRFIIGRAIEPQFVCSVEFLDTHNGFVAALAGIAVAIFTYTLYTASIEQAELTRASIDLANKEYISSHRPKLHIQRITAIALEAGQPAHAVILAINTGDTDAFITAIGIDIFTRHRGVPGSGACNAVPRPLANQICVAPGQEASLQAQGGIALTREAITGIHQWALDLCMLGIIQYIDGNGTLRPTSFFRIYDIERNRYRHAPPDDEHADREYEG